MRQAVMIKGTAYGLTVVVDPELPFLQLKHEVASKFRESSAFFKNARMAIAFEGRPFTDEEQMELVSAVSEASDIQILCVVDTDRERSEMFRRAAGQSEGEGAGRSSGAEERSDSRPGSDSGPGLGADDSPGRFYKGTLRGGQVLNADGSAIILGDVNPGATVIAQGSIVVLGALKGTAYAGMGGGNAFVAALEMEPMQIRIGDVIARCGDAKIGGDPPVPKIAFVEDENIYVETICKEVINDINFD